VQQARLAFESSAVDDFGAVPMRTNELMHSEADTHRLRSLGWAAQYTIANGLEQLATMQVKQIQSA